MIGGIIATHAGLANGFLEAVEMIAGKQENLLAVSLREGDGLEILIERLQKAAAAMEGEELVIFTDLFGATPLPCGKCAKCSDRLSCCVWCQFSAVTGFCSKTGKYITARHERQFAGSEQNRLSLD